MKHFAGQEPVEAGLYVDPRRLSLATLSEDGRLPGDARRRWYRLPLPLMLPVAAAISLGYVVFLPLIGLLIVGGLLLRRAARWIVTGCAIAVRRGRITPQAFPRMTTGNRRVPAVRRRPIHRPGAVDKPLDRPDRDAA